MKRLMPGKDAVITELPIKQTEQFKLQMQHENIFLRKIAVKCRLLWRKTRSLTPKYSQQLMGNNPSQGEGLGRRRLQQPSIADRPLAWTM
jgi:hypothetical protein